MLIRAHFVLEQFRRYLEEHGYDTSGMGFVDGVASSSVGDVKDVPSFDKV